MKDTCGGKRVHPLRPPPSLHPPPLHPPWWLVLKSLLLFFKASVIASVIGFAYHRQCHYHHIHKRYLNHGECEGGRGERVNMNSSHFGSYSSH